jgi:hypothetical protein
MTYTPPLPVEPSDAPDFSVVLAAPPGRAGHAATEALEFVIRACTGIASEIIVVGASVPTPTGVHDDRPLVIGLPAPTGPLVPHLWGLGLARARGRVVAFTSDEFRVSSGWARALLGAIRAGAAGAGGRVTLSHGAGATSRAMWLLRYARFAATERGGATSVLDIPGDNAAYDRAELDQHATDFAEGFWEMIAHRRIHAAGKVLVAANDAEAQFRPRPMIARFAASRFHHGRHFGRYRVEGLGHSRWRCILATPVVPFVLAGRALRHAARAGAGLIAQLPAVPALIFFAAFWAVGEAIGASQSRARRT